MVYRLTKRGEARRSQRREQILRSARRLFVRQGYVVAVPCMTPFGERLGKSAGKTDLCADTFIRMQLLGKTLMAENLRDCLWALELLARHEEVDAERLGCVGLSLGGRMTMLTTALSRASRCA